MAVFKHDWNTSWGRSATPEDGDTWGGGTYYAGNGFGEGVPVGYVYSDGKWVSPLTAQTNNIASQKLGYEAQNAGLENQLKRGQLQAQQGYNQVASTAGNRLNTLLQNPASVADTPGYQFTYNQGLEAVNRTAAARGQLGSGNRLYDLTKYGQGMASQTYNNTVNQLGSFLNKTQMTPDNQYKTQGNTTTLGGSY